MRAKRESIRNWFARNRLSYAAPSEFLIARKQSGRTDYQFKLQPPALLQRIRNMRQPSPSRSRWDTWLENFPDTSLPLSSLHCNARVLRNSAAVGQFPGEVMSNRVSVSFVAVTLIVFTLGCGGGNSNSTSTTPPSVGASSQTGCNNTTSLIAGDGSESCGIRPLEPTGFQITFLSTQQQVAAPTPRISRILLRAASLSGHGGTENSSFWTWIRQNAYAFAANQRLLRSRTASGV